MNTTVLDFDDEYKWSNAKKIDCPYDYALKIKQFASKQTDLIMYKIKRTVNDMRGQMVADFYGVREYTENTKTDAEREEQRQENIRRSARRAKQAVQDAVRTINADHMITLTTRENITDRAKFFEIYTRFVRLVRTKEVITKHGQKYLKTLSQKREWPFVAVDEFQQRGAYHMHIAVHGKQDINLLLSCWYTALGGTPNDSGVDTRGAVNVAYKQKRFGGKTEKYNVMALVNYLVKYIAKSFEQNDQLGINRYSRSAGIPKPQVVKQFIWSSYKNNGGDFWEAVKEVYAIADFMGLQDLVPWNKKASDEIFVLRGVWE